MLSSVDLPLPEWPEQDEELAFVDVEIDAAQRVHLHLAHRVDLRQAADLEDRSHAVLSLAAAAWPGSAMRRQRSKTACPARSRSTGVNRSQLASSHRSAA